MNIEIMEIIQSIVRLTMCILAFGYALFAGRSWNKGYEIEAIWRMLNAVFWAVVYYGHFICL